MVSVKQICLQHIKGTGRFEHFYQLFLVIFWQCSGWHCHSQHISRWLSEAQGMAARHSGTLLEVHCALHSLWSLGKENPPICCALEPERSVGQEAPLIECKDKMEEHFKNITLALSELLTRSF